MVSRWAWILVFPMSCAFEAPKNVPQQTCPAGTSDVHGDGTVCENLPSAVEPEATGTTAENDTGSVHQVVASDPEGDALTHGLVTGTDTVAVAVDPATGVLSLVTALDFEAPQDGDANNVYIVGVEVSDGTSTSLQQVTVSVTDVDAPPTIDPASAVQVSEGQAFTEHIAVATDPEGGTITYSIVDGADAAAVQIDPDTGELFFVEAPDAEMPADANADNVYEVIIGASDGTTTVQQTVTITVINTVRVEILLPTPTGNHGGLTGSTWVSGRLLDAELGTPTAAASVDVNGVVAQRSASMPGYWSVELPVVIGDNPIHVVATSPEGATDEADTVLRNAAVGRIPRDVAYDPTTDTAYVTDRIAHDIYAVDLTSGLRWIVSGRGRGGGAAYVGAEYIDIDVANGRLYYVRNGLITDVVAVDIASGDRTVVSATSETPAFSLARGLTFDAAAGRLLVATTRGTNGLYEVNVATGARTSLAAIARPHGIAVDTANDRLIIVDQSIINGLVEVDSTTWPYSNVFSGAASGEWGRGAGPGFVTPVDVALRPSTGSFLVVDYDRPGLIDVDPATGDRTIVFGSGVGSGFALQHPWSIVHRSTTGTWLVTDESESTLIEVDLATGEATLRPGAPPPRLAPLGVAASSDGTYLLVVNETYDAILRLDVATGAQTELSGAAVGVGPAFAHIQEIEIDEAGGRAIVLDRNNNALVAVDLSNGDRSELSGATVGAGSALTSPLGFSFAAGSQTAFVSSGAAVIAVDVQTGDRSALSDASTGTGPTFTVPFGSAYDSDCGCLFVADPLRGAIVRVDAATGDRQDVSGGTVGSGPVLDSPSAVAIDSTTGKLLLAASDAIISVDPTTGDRTLLPDTGTSLGVHNVHSMAVDAERRRGFTIDSGYFMVVAFDLDTGGRALLDQ